MGAAAPDPDDAVDETADGDDADAFDSLLAKLQGGAKESSSPKRDPMDMFMMMMMMERREAKAEKAQFLKLAMSFLPTLLAKKEPDPILMQVIGSMLSGKQQEQFTQSMMLMQQQAAEANAKMTRETFEATSRIREEATQRQLEQMEDRMEKNSQPATSPITEILREIRLSVEPLIAAKLGAPAVAGTSTASKIAHNPPPNIDAPKDVIPMVLRALKSLHETPNLSKAQKAAVRAKLAVAIMDHPPLATAILEEEVDTVTEICKPYVLADAELLAWVAKPEVGKWLSDYLLNQIAPIIDSMQEAQEKEDGTFVEPAPETNKDPIDTGHKE